MERERTVSRGPGSAAPERAFERLRARIARLDAHAWREAWGALWTSRLIVWATGMLGVLLLGRAPATAQYDPSQLTAPFSYLGNLLVAPAARWDSVWYLGIARDGYDDPGHAKAAFYPLYPLLMHVGGWIVGSQLVAGILISLVCFLVALVLLHRLAALELGTRDARSTVLLVAFFPTAFFFSAVYTESLFLLLTVGAFLAARQGRWAWAGIAGALAALTRNSGVVTIVPLVLLYAYGPRSDRPPLRAGPWWRPRYAIGFDALWLALVPLGLIAYLVYSAIAFGDPLAPFHAQEQWLRHFVPLGALTGGIKAAVLGLRQIAHGSPTPRYFTDSGGDPFQVAGESLLLLGFVVFVLLALVGALRRLPLAYGAYALVALLLTLSYPVDAQPLMSLPRYVLTLFPLQMWLARWCAQRSGGVERAVGVSAAMLGLLTAYFAYWGFVA